MFKPRYPFDAHFGSRVFRLHDQSRGLSNSRFSTVSTYGIVETRDTRVDVIRDIRHHWIRLALNVCLKKLELVAWACVVLVKYVDARAIARRFFNYSAFLFFWHSVDFSRAQCRLIISRELVSRDEQSGSSSIYLFTLINYLVISRIGTSMHQSYPFFLRNVTHRGIDSKSYDSNHDSSKSRIRRDMSWHDSKSIDISGISTTEN